MTLEIIFFDSVGVKVITLSGSELSALCTLCSCKMLKMCKVHTQRISEICLLSFLHLLSLKKPKRCKIHIPRNLNYQHFRHNRNPIMLKMLIVHVFKITFLLNFEIIRAIGIVKLKSMLYHLQLCVQPFRFKTFSSSIQLRP